MYTLVVLQGRKGGEGREGGGRGGKGGRGDRERGREGGVHPTRNNSKAVLKQCVKP